MKTNGKLKWTLKNIPIKELKPFEKNPRRMTEKGMKDLEKSLDNFGLAEPIVINKNTNEIIGGHARFYALQNKGITSADCYIPDRQLTEQQVKELNIRLNKNIAGEFDLDILANEFNLTDLLEWGFDEKELDLDLWNDKTDEQLDDVPDVQKEVVSKTGDLFLLDGKHRVTCGDSTKKEDVAKLMDGKKADMVFTDPPYNIGYDYWDYIDKKDSNEYYKMMLQSLQSLQSLCDRIVITTGHQNMGLWFSLAKPTHIASWVKKNATSGCKISMFNIWEPIFFYGDFKKFRKRDNDVFEVNNTNQKFVEGHSCPKQVNLLSDIITNYSRIKEVVLDIFLGSGSTLIACEQTNRICYGTEIDPFYIDVILRRYHNLYPDKEIKCLNRKFDFEKLLNA